MYICIFIIYIHGHFLLSIYLRKTIRNRSKVREFDRFRAENPMFSIRIYLFFFFVYVCICILYIIYIHEHFFDINISEENYPKSVKKSENLTVSEQKIRCFRSEYLFSFFCICMYMYIYYLYMDIFWVSIYLKHWQARSAFSERAYTMHIQSELTCNGMYCALPFRIFHMCRHNRHPCRPTISPRADNKRKRDVVAQLICH
jgi:hypothetical protein